MDVDDLPQVRLVLHKLTSTDTLLSPIELFIHNHQPPDADRARVWRCDLVDLINELRKETHERM